MLKNLKGRNGSCVAAECVGSYESLKRSTQSSSLINGVGMANLEAAIRIAAAAHDGQKDKQGLPYILHPLRVMLDVSGEQAQIVAVLHDVVEDTQVTFGDLGHEGFSEAILAALQLVTHDKATPYADYVVRCKQDPIARQVKLADLRDNSSLSRLLLRPTRLEGDSARMHRYVLSYRYLRDEIDESEYRRLMPRFE
jgi:hypothetical protein